MRRILEALVRIFIACAILHVLLVVLYAAMIYGDFVTGPTLACFVCPIDQDIHKWYWYALDIVPPIIYIVLGYVCYKLSQKKRKRRR